MKNLISNPNTSANIDLVSYKKLARKIKNRKHPEKIMQLLIKTIELSADNGVDSVDGIVINSVQISSKMN